MAVSISVEYSRLKFNSLWAKEFKHRIPEEHQGDGYYNSTGDMEQGRHHHPLPTQLQRNHPTITRTQHSPTRKRLRKTNNLVHIKIPQPHQHNKGNYYTWLKIPKQLLPSRKYIFLCAMYVPPSESPYYSEIVLHIEGRDKPLPGQEKRAHLQGSERKNRTTAGLHRHTKGANISTTN